MSDSLPMTVVTTTQAPTKSMQRLSRVLKRHKCPLIVIGDRRGPARYNVPGAELVTVKDQLALPYRLAIRLPFDHYSRKNLGYLLALERGASCIYETDDDNAPLRSWRVREPVVQARCVKVAGWVNVYRAFSDENIWPRGFPLDLASQPLPKTKRSSADVADIQSPIQQGLANGSPDVDAVWRLVLDKSITFRDELSVYLPRGAWCPFNSQSTWWWPPAYPLMYLPSHCTFRMTDIWRSLIAQRCLWELNTGVVFHAAEVVQARNEHNLIRDFQQEISGYLRNREIADWLSDLTLKRGEESLGRNLLVCYERLVCRGVFPVGELLLIEAWLSDIKCIDKRLARRP